MWLFILEKRLSGGFFKFLFFREYEDEGSRGSRYFFVVEGVVGDYFRCVEIIEERVRFRILIFWISILFLRLAKRI